MTAVVFAPNWLGDVVMALPALADLRRHVGDGRLVVAARRSVAPLYSLVPGVEIVVLPGLRSGLSSAVRAIRADADVVRAIGASLAVVFPNSIRAAAVAKAAGVPERVGYHRDFRGVLLTRAVRRPASGTHQVDAYRQLLGALGIANGAREPRLDPTDAAIEDARAMLRQEGWDGRPLVGLAPGAAGGGAKRWPLDRVAAVVGSLVRDRGAACVLVGADGDRSATAQVIVDAGRMSGSPAPGRVIDLAGRTTLPQLAGLLRLCGAFVSNDSGAMHLAAAVGTPLVAVFGPTNERATAPVPRPGGAADVLAGSAWCRPCRFRECPLDHRCMTSIPAARVIEAVSERL
jgi:heptosyltransferase II